MNIYEYKKIVFFFVKTQIKGFALYINENISIIIFIFQAI